MAELTHLDADGAARMVDVGDKEATSRRAVAEAVLVTGERVMDAVRSGSTPKGDVYSTARLAGIMAAKKTAELIPMCHSLPMDHVEIRFEPAADRIRIEASAATRAATGVEMEALTAVSVAALTVYDMCKAIDRSMVIEGIRLVHKAGGRSGDYHAP